MFQQNSSEYDVVIIGGGMVGASLACILQIAGSVQPLKVLVIEAAPIRRLEQAQQPSFDARSTVLSQGSAEYLQQLGLWQKLEPIVEPIKKIHVSDKGKFGAVRIDSLEQGVTSLGYVVENQGLGQVLNQALFTADKIEVCSSAKVSDIQPGEAFIKVEIELGQHHVDSDKPEENQLMHKTVVAKLVVVAEGGRSDLCKKLGIYRTNQQYNQSAVIANVAFKSDHFNIAYERFTAKGPLALLPLMDLEGEHRAALVWTHPTESVDEILGLNDATFLKLLSSDFGSRLGEFTKVGKRYSYPLSLQLAEEQVRPGIVLLGNSAHSLHPVAGQGFNLAFRDTIQLAHCILTAVEQGKSPGAIEVLQKYLRQVEADQDKTIAFSHHMTNLFSNDNMAISLLRKFGLLGVDLIPPLKNILANQAMGKGSSRVQL